MAEQLTEKVMMDAILKTCLSSIGPERSLESSSKTYTFNDSLKMSSSYFSMVGIFKGFVDKYLEGAKGNVNYNTAYDIGDKIVRMVSERIIQRSKSIQEPLNKYLNDGDVEFAIEKTKELLVGAKGNFSVILLTNLIDLSEIQTIKIGKVDINKFDTRYSIRFPAQVPIKQVTLLSLRDSIPREEFLEENKNNVAMEITTNGHHFHDEGSGVVDHSADEFKHVLAYLYMCEHYLKRVKGEQFEIRTKELQTENLYFLGPPQTLKFFVSKNDPKDNFVEVNSDAKFPKKQFVIDNATFEQIKSKCCLSGFNKLNNEIKGTIANRVFTSFTWFLKGIQETDITDKAISFFISLESLLSVSNSADILAEHVALLSGGDVEYKYETKRKFKKTYDLRNKIMHGGKILKGNDYKHIIDLLDYTVWSLRNVLVNIERISLCSNYGDDPIKVFFEKLKLGND